MVQVVLTVIVKLLHTYIQTEELKTENSITEPQKHLKKQQPCLEKKQIPKESVVERSESKVQT